MSNYYGFKTDGGNTNDVLGYELSGPAAFLGALLVIATFVLSPRSGLIGLPTPPTPSLIALGLAVIVYFLTHIADELGTTGLKLIVVVCIIAMIAVFPLVFALIEGESVPGVDSTYDREVAWWIGAAFLVYLSVILWLTMSSLRTAVSVGADGAVSPTQPENGDVDP